MSSSRDHAQPADTALDIERAHREVMRRYPNIMAALHRSELAVSSAKPPLSDKSRDEP